MPLQSLELFNFKSYKGTQVIDLGQSPFICIIGPNGAGKSNLMDAISFVLGVKSAQLRSTQLRDFVYRGRTAEQPEDDDEMDIDSQERARNAHVIAIYKDDKGKQWRFKRSISTSGQSTYSLNGQDTTWRAYNAQLEKFNVLVKAKNFLVFQGDVEGVASQDSKALAKLIDRISGSLDLAPAYEKAKEEQDKAAEASTSNYAKKRSMLTEVKQFKEQREEVRQWEKRQDEKDAAVRRHLLWKLYHLTNDITSQSEKIEAANETLTGLRDKVDADAERLREAKKEQAQAALQLKKRENSVKKAEKSHEEKRPELVAAEAQIAHAKRKMENANTLLERVTKDEERQSDNLETLKKGSKDIKKRMDEAAEKQRQKSQASGRTLSNQDLEEYRTLRASANLLAIPERQQLESLRREQRSQRDALASVEDKIQQAQRRQSTLDEEVDRLSEREIDMEGRFAEINTERETVKAQLDQAVVERQRISIKETELNEKLQDVFAKLLSAGADKRESEREAKMKETINEMKKIFPGVHGRVIDLCRPTARKYDTAVMTVLGRNIDAVVVDTERVAIDCIEYMRNQRKGQATFIPLDTIQVKPVQEKYRNFARGARLAIDCIEYEPAVERAMQHACGSSLICDTMDVAKYVCYEKNQEVKAVTLEGTVIHKSGLITGGQGSGSTRRFNDSDVQNLQKAKEVYMQQLQELNKSKPSQKDDNGLLDRLARLDAEATVAKDDLDALKTRLKDLKAEQQHVKSELGKLNPDAEKRRQALAASDQKISGLLSTVQQADDGVFTAFCAKIGVSNIRQYEDVQLKMAREEAEAVEQYTVQLARIEHQINFESTQLQNTKERLASLRTTVERSEASIQQLETTKQTIAAELDSIQASIEKAKEKLETAKEAYEAACAKVSDVREAVRVTQKELDKALKVIAGCNDEITRAASDRYAIYRRCRLEEIDLPLVKGRLDKVPVEENAADLEMDIDDDGTQRPAKVDDYGITPDYEELEEDDLERSDNEYGQDMEDTIAMLKADLEKYNPNMKAADRLADVERELDDTEKEADATRRQSRLARDQFQELKKKRCDLFNAAYHHMSNCIDTIYKDLTKTKENSTGGVAFLSLEDAEEPYLSGVKYNVMPPNQPFIEMEQLSGGEKTMAALALLFAIHSYHPAPFFVLDEVDAALDQTNVTKLARYIREQARHDVQFLIISLKADLYQHADGLVGVYREQEENTSKSLTLDLRKYVEA